MTNKQARGRTSSAITELPQHASQGRQAEGTPLSWVSGSWPSAWKSPCWGDTKAHRGEEPSRAAPTVFPQPRNPQVTLMPFLTAGEA